MSQITSWSTTAASNNTAAPNGFPEGMAAADYNNSAREVMAAVRVWWNQINPTVIATGTADALVLTYSPAPSALTSGITFAFYKNASNNTGAVTLNVNSLGAKTVYRRDGSTNLSAGDMVANALYEVVFDGTNFRLKDIGI